VHIFFGIQLTLANSKSKPDGYAVKKSLSTTFAGKNMIWTGLVIGMFLVYHLLHFTIQIINPGVSANIVSDTLGRPDVSGMVVYSFRKAAVSLTYVLAMTAIVLHLTHGIQSSFQTLGLTSERTQPVIIKTGAILAFILFLGYVLVPILVFAGIMNG
jgi:succinate dehydrogenase / fumarate reductase cytochrome b subunit